MAGTQEDDHRESRRRRRELRKNKPPLLPVTVKPTVKAARICKSCGNWIQLRDTFYANRPMGKQWIHVRARGMTERKYLWTIERCYAEPRDIPTLTSI